MSTDQHKTADHQTRLNRLSPAALSAAMRGGTEGWGRHASISHVRYCEPITAHPRRRIRCGCGCDSKRTHNGMANGIALFSGCELSVRRWVADPDAAIRLVRRQSNLRQARRLRADAARMLAAADELEQEIANG